MTFTSKNLLATIAVSSLLSACQYKVEPISSPAFNIYSSYGDKLSGKWLLSVDAIVLKKDITPDDVNCALHTYPLDASLPFKTSAQQTIANQVAELELIESPVDRDGMAARNVRGMIIVRAEQMNVRMRVIPAAYSATVDVQVEISASILVDGKDGRLLGQTLTGSGNGKSDVGAACEGGTKAISIAVSEATRQILTRLGETFVNSERVRSSR